MKPFHAQPIEDVLTAVRSDRKGLTEAEAKIRLEQDGKNALQGAKKRSMFLKFIDQMKDVMILVLLAAALISGILTIVEQNYAELVDSALILLIVIINAVIGLVQENKAEAAMDALKNLNKPYAKVIRDGTLTKIKSEDIVVGDVVVLEAGDIVPADIRLFEAASLKVEEAALTGESVPSEKGIEVIDREDAPLGDRGNMCYSSGVISYGRGQGVVVATGMKTEVGKIATMLNEGEAGKTPLQVQLAKTAKMLSVIVLAIAAVIFAAAVIRGVTGGGDENVVDLIMDAFMTAVAIAVAAIPEGLPAVVTIVLAIGVQRMSERKAIVRNLPAVETLGCCEIICSDKTGTLTLNQMTVKELYTPETGLYAAGAEPAESVSAETLVRTMALCNDTVEAEGKLMGDPTETALVAYARDIGKTGLNELYPRIAENPFDSVRKRMATINTVDGKAIGHIKGAPDLLLERCNRILIGDSIRPITADDVEAIRNANHAMASKALRVLAAAIKPEDNDCEQVESDMVFVGLVGMIDPPRPEVKDAVRVCKKAGMTAIMITGDHKDTAAAIASEIGILEEGKLVITGAELDKLSDAEFMERLSDFRVFARVSPENKVRIVKAFKAAGKIVAMTGDGVNDAPSIKTADIGVGMGITGTDVSKGASDMVLADDNFATIVSAVEEGRKVYSNIKKAVQYLLSANIAEVLCLFIATVFLNVDFLTPVMILWVNLVTDSLPALALGTEAAEANIMNDPPRKSGSSLFAGKTGRDIFIQGFMQTALVMTSFCIGYYVLPEGIADHSVAMTMAFVTLCMIQLFHSYNLRSQKGSLFSKNPFTNKFLNISFIIGIVLVVLVLVIPGVGETLFDAAMLNGTEWAIALATSLFIIPMVELQKVLERAVDRRQGKANNK